MPIVGDGTVNNKSDSWVTVLCRLQKVLFSESKLRLNGIFLGPLTPSSYAELVEKKNNSVYFFTGNKPDNPSSCVDNIYQVVHKTKVLHNLSFKFQIAWKIFFLLDFNLLLPFLNTWVPRKGKEHFPGPIQNGCRLDLIG